MAALAEKVVQAERNALGENTPLWAQHSGPYDYNFERLGIHSRNFWMYTVVVLLFFGKAVQPFVNDAVHVTQAALIDDPELMMSTMTLGGLVSAQDFTTGISKIFVAMSIKEVGPRRAWLVVFVGGALNMLVIATTRYTATIFVCTVLQAFMYSFIYPATTMTIAGWVDGHALGRAIGCVAVATKVSPIAMSTIYAHLLVSSWRDCFFFASAVFAVALVLFLVFMRSSAQAIGFRDPTPPGARNDKKPRAPPLAHEPSSLRALSIVFSMRRTWALLLGFCLLVLLKSSAKFATIYAKTRLGLNPSDATSLFTTYAIASACSGLFGGIAYDIVPGGKVGIGVLMTCLNILNCIGFAYAFLLEQSNMVTMTGLKVFMAIVGFAGVLPVSLPFQIYAMAIGGVTHCGMLVAAFEGVAMCVEALLDLVIGSLLEAHNFQTWLLINLILAILGTCFMALFYTLDYSKAPRAPVLTAVPSMNFLTRNNSNLQQWMASFADGSPPETPPESPKVGRRASLGSASGAPPPRDRSKSPSSRTSFDLGSDGSTTIRVDSKVNLQAIGEEEAELQLSAALAASSRSGGRQAPPSAFLNARERDIEKAASDDNLYRRHHEIGTSQPVSVPPSATDSDRSSGSVSGSPDGGSADLRSGSFPRPPPKSIMRRSSSFAQ